MIEDGKVVSIDYQVVDENNILIDSADEQGPIVYLTSVRLNLTQ